MNQNLLVAFTLGNQFLMEIVYIPCMCIVYGRVIVPRLCDQRNASNVM